MLTKESALTFSSLGNLAVPLAAQGQWARSTRLLHMAIRLADASQYSDRAIIQKIILAALDTDCGRLREAEASLVALRDTHSKNAFNGQEEAYLLSRELYFLFRSGTLSDTSGKETLERVKSLGYRTNEIRCHYVIALWHQSHDRNEAALDALGDLIALANEIDSPDLPKYEAYRAISLAALGRHDDARRIAEKVEKAKKPPHVSLACLYLELGENDAAKAHALKGYREAWCDGPPHCEHWDLEDCKKVLTALGEPEPQLPPFDPSKVEPFDFEPDVERLIEKKLAEKAEAECKEAKRLETTKQPTAAKNGQILPLPAARCPGCISTAHRSRHY